MNRKRIALVLSLVMVTVLLCGCGSGGGTAAEGEYQKITLVMAVNGTDTCFALANILGVDKDLGDRVCHGHFNCVASKENWAK